MDLSLIKTYMHEQLRTTEAVGRAAAAVGVSPATMYRFKSNPAAMQLGHFLELSKTIGLPLGEQASWLPHDFLAEERHRLRLEMEVAKSGGTRMSVTPYFSVHVELPSVIDLTAEDMYGAANWSRAREEYLVTRAERKRLYDEGRYTSKEIINGHLYADFFNTKRRYAALTEDDKRQQIEALVESLHRSNMHRRVFLGHDLPIVTHYSTAVALVRFGEFTIEVKGSRIARSIADVFDDYYARSDLKSISDVEAFLLNPQSFLLNRLSHGG